MPPDAAAPPRPPSPAAALAGHAARHPHRPFLFWPDGLDWRWTPYAEAAAEVERLRAGLPARLEEESAAPAAASAALREIAGAPPPDLVARAEALAADLAPQVEGGPRRPRREVVVLSPPFAEEGERTLFAWAVVAGAAVVVEPSRAALVATAAWARPTVFRGAAAEVAALAREAEAAERAGFAGGWRRVRRWLGSAPPPPPPFGRLHTILVAGAPAAAVDAAFWSARGARVLAEAWPGSAAPWGGATE